MELQPSFFLKIPVPPPAPPPSEAPASAATLAPPGEATASKCPENTKKLVTRISLIKRPTSKGLPPQEVVLPPFLLVAEDLIGLVDLLQVIFTVRITRVPVRVIHHRELAIGFLYLFVCRFPPDSQEPVIILHSQRGHLL